MKLNVLSDLHLSVDGMDRPRNDADVVVLAGDIARPRESAVWAMGFDKPVLYVLGNHEFYGGSIDGTPTNSSVFVPAPTCTCSTTTKS